MTPKPPNLGENLYVDIMGDEPRPFVMMGQRIAWWVPEKHFQRLNRRGPPPEFTLSQSERAELSQVKWEASRARALLAAVLASVSGVPAASKWSSVRDARAFLDRTEDGAA